MIAAIGAQTRAIGKGNALLWHIRDDLKRFKEITSGHPVIMGRKTYESIGKPLPNRTNIIITRSPTFQAANCIVCGSPEKALQIAKEKEKNEIFIIGGGELYKELLPMADRLYLTLVESDESGDTFFPDYSEFKKVIGREARELNGLRYEWLMLER